MNLALLRNFDLLAAASGGVARLRDLILVLAVQGKLVPQNPDDEPAEKLLALSRTHMRARMTQGIAKKEKPAAEVADHEMAFAAPRCWQWCRLTDTGEYINGLAFKPTDWRADGIPIIRIQNLSGRNSEFNRVEGNFDSSVLVRAGDILVSWSATLDAFIWEGESGVLNQHIFRVEPAPCVDKSFLYWLLKWAIRDLAESEHAHGLVMSHINRGPFLAKPIALPPLAEQARIVARLEELMRLCDALEAGGRLEAQQHARLLGTLLDTLTDSTTREELADNWNRVATHFDLLLDRPQAVDALEETVLRMAVRGLLVPQDPREEPARELLERLRSKRERSEKPSRSGGRRLGGAFTMGDRDFLPPGWSWSVLPDLCAIAGGSTPSKADPRNWSGPIPWVSPKDMKKPYIDEAQDHVSAATLSGGLSLIPPGSLLMVVRGMILAHSFPVAETRVPVTINQDMKALTPFEPKLLGYLTLVCRGMKKEILNLVDRSTHGTCKLESPKIFGLPIAIPPLAEQTRIVARVSELRRVCADMRQSLEAAQAVQARLADALVARALA